MNRLLILMIISLVLASPLAQAQSSTYGSTCERDSHGHIKRSLEAKHEFKRENPCPANGKAKGRCEGYIVDHVVPLKRGGADLPENMQWQTVEDSRAKDAVE